MSAPNIPSNLLSNAGPDDTVIVSVMTTDGAAQHIKNPHSAKLIEAGRMLLEAALDNAEREGADESLVERIEDALAAIAEADDE